MSSGYTVEVTVEQDEITAEVSRAFDVAFDGVSRAEIPPPPEVPEDWGIGVIVGPSGAGKSTLLQEFGEEETVEWDADRAIVSHFGSHEEAVDRLSATGLNSIPSWLRPYRVLSTGEKFRADLARRVKDGAVIDEYTSVVDRNVAKAASCALAKYVKRKEIRRLLLVGCHYDVLEWLQPDWVYDLGQSPPKMVTGRYLQRPEIRLRIYHCERHIWPLFAKHHYLSADIHNAARCHLITWQTGEGEGEEEREEIVGFIATLSFPHPKVKRAFRGHRVVVLPDFQGLGIGMRSTEAIGDNYLSTGERFYVRTANPRMVSYYRSKPESYRELAEHRDKECRVGATTTVGGGNWLKDEYRPTVGFEYLGMGQTLEWEKREPPPPRARPGITAEESADRKAQIFAQVLADKAPEEIGYYDVVQFCLHELSDYDAKPGVRVQWTREMRENIRLGKEEARLDKAKHILYWIEDAPPLGPAEEPRPLPELPGVPDPLLLGDGS